MKYRKKPVVIEAIQWDGQNEDEIQAFSEKVRLAIVVKAIAWLFQHLKES